MVGVNSPRSMIGAIAGIGMLMGSFAAERERREAPAIEVVLGVEDGLPDTLRSGREYIAKMRVEWNDRIDPIDGRVAVYVSRRDGGVAYDTAEKWPLACATNPGAAIGELLMRCSFEAPSPGSFALLLEVSDEDGNVVAEGLYAHEVED